MMNTQEIKKITVIGVHKDENTKTAFVWNKGIDNTYILNKTSKTYDIFKVSDFDLNIIFSEVFDDEIVGCGNVNNLYNRDQKMINIMKNQTENTLILEGYTIVPHSGEYEPSVNADKLTKILNDRDYLTVLQENIVTSEKKLEHLKNEEKQKSVLIDELDTYYINRKQDIDKKIEEYYSEISKKLDKYLENIKTQVKIKSTKNDIKEFTLEFDYKAWITVGNNILKNNNAGIIDVIRKQYGLDTHDKFSENDIDKDMLDYAKFSNMGTMVPNIVRWISLGLELIDNCMYSFLYEIKTHVKIY